MERSKSVVGDQKTVLRLYVAGISAHSTRAIQNVRRICDEKGGAYELAVVDIFQQPDLATADQIVAVPTLIKKQPAPSRRIIGDLSDPHVIRVGLDLETS